MLEERERVALDLLNRLPDGWRPGPTSYDPGIRRWLLTARGPHPGRGKVPDTITGTGEDELAAMADLRNRLDERRRGEKLLGIELRGRAAYPTAPRRNHAMPKAGRYPATSSSG